MADFPRHHSHFPLFRRFWKPVAVTGAGGVAIAAWFEELISYAAEILGLILLPVLAGVIYLMDIFFFKSRTPNRDDLEKPADRGANK
jgi:hypothetical protein